MNENKPRRRAQAQAAQKKARKSGLSRVMLVAMMLVMVAVVSIGGTMAWLQASTGDVVNTFTVGDINITLQEYVYDDATNKLTAEETTEGNDNYKIIPGRDLPKDPFVTVKGGSEPCWLFVKITEENWTLEDVTYTVDGNVWTPLKDYSDVYYKKLETVTATDTSYSILTGNTVYVSDDLTKEELATFFDGDTTKQPKLSFQAFAIQSTSLKKDNVDVTDPAVAWEMVKPADDSSTETP